jgi:peptidoglycan-N-acetylglucosamine deacetylase
MRQVGAFFFAVVAASGIAGAFLAAAPARAQTQNCPGNPNALGTSRVLVVGPGEYTRLGTMQYPQTLPLADKEVVLTFDDGPLPPYSNQILDILTAQCVKATYFIVGEMARAFPNVVRREYQAGYTIGTHSQDHPLRFEKLSGEKLRHEIDDGIASVSAALGDANDLAPFFRIPGLGRSDEIEHQLALRSLVVFSADVVADDWHRRIKPAEIIKRAMGRLEKRGKGILLLHDIHKVTVTALPGLLTELKNHGFHIVQVVPPTPAAPETVGGPKAWTLASAMPEEIIIDEGAAAPTWPPSDVSLTPDEIVLPALPAPDAAAFDIGYRRGRALNLALDSGGDAQWPNPSEPAVLSSGPQLPAPSVQDVGVSLQGQKLVGGEVGLQPRLDVPAPIEHGRHRHERLHAHRRARAPPAADGQHANLFHEIRSLAALLTPARAQ